MNTDILQEKSTKGTKKGDFWQGVSCMSLGAGLMADWRWAFGSTVELVQPFLRPTGKIAESYPCPARPACECRHEVRETGFGLVAVCMCGPGECETYVIESQKLE